MITDYMVTYAVLTTDPSGTWDEGATYWNSALGRLRVYHSGAWTSQ